MESLTLEGKIIFKKGEGQLTNAGLTSIYGGADITIEEDALDIGGGAMYFEEEAKLTFDYSKYDISGITEATTIYLTGLVDEQAEGVITINAPESTTDITVEAGYNETYGRYMITIAPAREEGAVIYWASGTYGDEEDPAVFTYNDQVVGQIFSTDKIAFGNAESYTTKTLLPVEIADNEYEGELIIELAENLDWTKDIVATNMTIVKRGAGQFKSGVSVVTLRAKELILEEGSFACGSNEAAGGSDSKATPIVAKAGTIVYMSGKANTYLHVTLENGAMIENEGTADDLYKYSGKALSALTLAEGATGTLVGNGANFGVGSSSATGTLALNNGTLVKEGTNTVTINTGAAYDAGTFEVKAGTLAFKAPQFAEGTIFNLNGGAFSATDSVTFGGAITVKTASSLPAEGLKVLEGGTYPETLPAVTLVIGDETLSGYALEAKEDGLYVVSATVEGLLFYLK